MSTTLHRSPAPAEEPHHLLRAMLEERFAVHTNRLTELTIYGRLPGHGGHDARSLDSLAAAARQGIADTAQALRRMSDGTYGVCESCHCAIPLGRLRAVPHARRCSGCDPDLSAGWAAGPAAS